MKVTFLGSGASTGTPGIAIGWGNCDPANPRNRRLRPSILVEQGNTRLLVDTSPDLREQLIRTPADRLDAVLYTHAHADHLHGIDDLRSINRSMKAPLPIFGDAKTLEGINRRFGYTVVDAEAAAKMTGGFFSKPALVPNVVTPGSRFIIGGVEILPFDQDHGYSRTVGYRFGQRLAYSTDLVEMTEQGFAAVAGVDVWILGVFAPLPHPTHVHVEKALQWIARVGPRRAVMTHLSVYLDYEELRRTLPAGVEPAYDGMEIEVPT